MLLFFQVKCEQYWPSDTDDYRDIVVKVISVYEALDYTVRIFEVYKVEGVFVYFDLLLEVFVF